MASQNSAQEVLEKIRKQTYDRQAKYRNRKRQSGQVRVSVWVPHQTTASPLVLAEFA